MTSPLPNDRHSLDSSAVKSLNSELNAIQLSLREIQVLTFTLKGKNKHEIARIFQISEHSANSYAKTAADKLGIDGDIENRALKAATRAKELGLISVPKLVTPESIKPKGV